MSFRHALRFSAVACVSMILATIAQSATESREDRAMRERRAMAERVARASVVPRHPWCATSEETNLRQEMLHRWTEARKSLGEMKAASLTAKTAATFDHGIFFMNADSSVAPYDRPVDLQNSSLYFTRTGPTTFSVQKTALVYDSTMTKWGATLTASTAAPQYTLSGWSFPFGAQTLSTLYVSATKGLYFSAPPASDSYQWTAQEAFDARVPVVAPLLHTQKSWRGGYDVYVHEVAGSSITFTWKTVSTANENIQATLFVNGDVRLSYASVQNVQWGAVMVTTGAEGCYADQTALGSGSDATGDTVSVPLAISPMADVTSASLSRVSCSSTLEFRLNLAGALTQASIPPGAVIEYGLFTGATSAERDANSIYVDVSSTYVRVWPAGTARISGSTLVVHVADEQIVSAATNGTLQISSWYYTGGWATGDSVTVPVQLTPRAADPMSDLSTFTAPTTITSRPIVETFTLPTLDLRAIWDALKLQYGFTDDQIDQVAIYQTFPTDLIFYAGGYSTGGNPHVAGIESSDGTKWPKTPALMHLDRIGAGWNDSTDGILNLRTHEFGHRWLYFITVMENGVRTNHLNPDGAHPKQGVHIPAAVSVVTATDASAMGGGVFTQTGANTYVTPAYFANQGYSWHELYLMGLAAASEVSQPWFYLNAQGLESPYYPAYPHTYTVTARTDVNFQQVLDAMGARNPSYATSQKTFNELVVVLQRASDPVPPASIPALQASYVDAFTARFNAITLGRGTVVHPAVQGPPANFGPGDANGDGSVTVADIFYLINNLFTNGPAPIGSGDANGDGAVTIADVFYLINYAFMNGPAPR